MGDPIEFADFLSWPSLVLMRSLIFFNWRTFKLLLREIYSFMIVSPLFMALFSFFTSFSFSFNISSFKRWLPAHLSKIYNPVNEFLEDFRPIPMFLRCLFIITFRGEESRLNLSAATCFWLFKDKGSSVITCNDSPPKLLSSRSFS